MSFPVMHSFAGYVVYKAGNPQQEKKSWALMLYCMLMANFADFDYIPGILTGAAAKFHRMHTHTLGAALFVAALAAGIIFLIRKQHVLKVFSLTFSSYLTHIMLDFWAGTSNRGLLLFWPFSNQAYYSDTSLLYSGATPQHDHHGLVPFVQSMFSWEGISRMLYETVFIFFILSAVSLIRQIQQRPAFRATSILHTAIAFAFLLILSAGH